MLDRSPTEAPPGDALSVARAILERLRADLEERHGFDGTSLCIAASDDVLSVRGTVLSWRTVDELVARLASALPEQTTVDLENVTLRRTGDFRVLQRPATPLYAACRGPRGRQLASELLEEDGPVELLEEYAGRRLVRAPDATLGWTTEKLGDEVRRHRLRPPRTPPGELDAWLRARLGRPYVLGGTSDEGFDCSGLVRRAYSAMHGVVLPRHSRDQLRFAHASLVDPRELSWDELGSGDLLFIRERTEGPCHVGLVVRRPQHAGGSPESPVVVHASESRRLVVADSVKRFVRGARSIASVKSQSLLDAYASFVGAEGIDLPRERHDIARFFEA